MASVLRDLAEVAPSRLPVLLLGPTGSGKEVAARELHRLSGRPGPMVAVNASALATGHLPGDTGDFGNVLYVGAPFGAGTTATFATGDTTFAPAGSTDNSGWNTTTYPEQGTGNKTRGAQFAVCPGGGESHQESSVFLYERK